MLVTRSDRWIEFDVYRILEETEFINEPTNIESLLVISQSFFTNISSKNKSLYEEHQKNSRFFTMLWHCDLQKSRSQEIDFWRDKVDIFVHFNPNIEHGLVASEHTDVLLWPGLPFPENFLSAITSDVSRKEPKLLFSGSKHRHRSVYSDFAANRIPCEIMFHGRGNGDATSVSYRDYIRRLAEFELVFANGYLNPNESILVGRVVESMLVGTTVLYESGSWINHFFEPYEHFIPVTSREDLVHKAKYLLNNLEYSRLIAQNAYEHYTKNYSSSQFWHEVKKLIDKRGKK